MTDREKLLEILKVAYEPRKIPQDDGSVSVCCPTDVDVADTIESAIIREYKHRADVALRALLIVCTNLRKHEEDDVNAELLARVVYTKALRKAEKELEEENNAKN